MQAKPTQTVTARLSGMFGQYDSSWCHGTGVLVCAACQNEQLKMSALNVPCLNCGSDPSEEELGVQESASGSEN